MDLSISCGKILITILYLGGLNAGLNDTQKKILTLIEENKFISLEEIANMLGLNKRTIEKSVNNLKEKKFLKRTGLKKSGYWEILR